MWRIIQPLLPVRDLRKGGGVRKYGDRLVVDSVFYVLCSGCQWRMLPRDLMPWDAAHRWFTKWRRDGTWDRVHDELRRQVRIRAGRDPEPSAAVIDAQSIKTSEGGEARGFDAGKRTAGRQRHVIVDTMGLLLVVAVTSASVQDRAGGRTVLARLAAGFRTISLVWADGGYANSVDSTLLSWVLVDGVEHRVDVVDPKLVAWWRSRSRRDETAAADRPGRDPAPGRPRRCRAVATGASPTDIRPGPGVTDWRSDRQVRAQAARRGGHGGTDREHGAAH